MGKRAFGFGYEGSDLMELMDMNGWIEEWVALEFRIEMAWNGME